LLPRIGRVLRVQIAVTRFTTDAEQNDLLVGMVTPTAAIHRGAAATVRHHLAAAFSDVLSAAAYPIEDPLPV